MLEMALRRPEMGAAHLRLNLLLLFCSLCPGSVTASNSNDLTIQTPPSFIHEKNPEIKYFDLDAAAEEEETNSFSLKEREFRCQVKDFPDVKYKWKKDGREFHVRNYLDRIAKIPGEGTFVFIKLREEDEGMYQCLASSGNGTAVDREIQFQQKYIKPFPMAEPEIVNVELGDPYQRTCNNPPASVPDPRLYWILMGIQKSRFQTVNSSHISMDNRGTIFFQYVGESDFDSELYYTCTAENMELKDYKFGNLFQLNILKNKRRLLTSVPPQEQRVSSGEELVGLRGEDLQLYCIFSSFPVKVPSWWKDGSPLQLEGRVSTENFGKSLLIRNITEDDAGTYKCDFEISPQLNREFDVQIEAAPFWPMCCGPASQNSSEGETVHFDCKANGIPSPTYTFYKNGEELSTGDGISIDGSVLTIHDLQKARRDSCGNVVQEGDNAVYQCRVENKHGYSWANFYLSIHEV